MLSFGSLFAGIGGFDRGLALAGARQEFAVEIDAACNSVRRRHFPDEETYLDVSTLTIRSTAKRPGLICGGFPCQDLSVAGGRAGLAGKRSGLFWEFMRIVGEFAPEWVLIENVAGLLSSDEGRDMGLVLGALAQRGYGFAYRVLDSQFWGVAQRRRRVFIVACLGDWRRAAEVLFEPDGLPWDPAPSRCEKSGLAGTLDAGAGIRRGAGINPGGIVGTLNTGGTQAGGFRSEPGEHLVAGCLPAHSVRHGHAMTTQQAAEGGHLIPIGIGGSDVAHAVNVDGSKFGSGRQGQDTFVVGPVAFKPSHYTRGKDGAPSEIVPPLSADADKGDQEPLVLAFSSKDDGRDAGEIIPTLRSMNFDQSHMNGGGQVAVTCAIPIDMRQASRGETMTNNRREGSSGGAPGTGIGEAGAPSSTVCESHVPAVAVGFSGRDRGAEPAVGREERPPHAMVDQVGTLDAVKPWRVASGLAVRRLTPRECERLQAFPDDWTRWGADGKEISDSARYRMLGNAVTVSVVEWIARRIVAIHEGRDA